MKIVGIIGEYHPFHRGHFRHIAQTKAAFPGAAIVVALSGSFVQRGEAAMLPAEIRAEMAVSCGADLVVRLPLPWSLASAEGFARGGAALLHTLGASVLSFGSELPDAGLLLRTAALLDEPSLNGVIRQELGVGDSYAAARTRAVSRFAPDCAAALTYPNAALGIEYCRQMRAYPGMTPFVVPRTGQHDGTDESEPSASLLRQWLRAGERERVYAAMPEAAGAVLERALSGGGCPPDPALLDAVLMTRLRCAGEADFLRAGDCSEGLQHRLLQAVREQGSVQAAADTAKTRRYAHARLRRILCRTALAMDGSLSFTEPPFVEPLAMNRVGQAVLAALPETVCVLGKPSAWKNLPETGRKVYGYEILAGDLLALAAPDPACRKGGGVLRRRMVVLE